MFSLCVWASGVHSSDSNAATSSVWSGNRRRISLEYLEYPSWDSKTLLSVMKDTALSRRSEVWRYSPTAHLSFSRLLPHFLSKHVRTHLKTHTLTLIVCVSDIITLSTLLCSFEGIRSAGLHVYPIHKTLMMLKSRDYLLSLKIKQMNNRKNKWKYKCVGQSDAVMRSWGKV